MFLEGLMTKSEARLFIIFLKVEAERHRDDIIKINKTVEYLRGKFDLK